jgi:hypothetical protein
MADIINLRLERKRKRRADSEAQAAESRARHGVTKGEGTKAKRSRELQEKRLDAHRGDRPELPD